MSRTCGGISNFWFWLNSECKHGDFCVCVRQRIRYRLQEICKSYHTVNWHIITKRLHVSANLAPFDSITLLSYHHLDAAKLLWRRQQIARGCTLSFSSRQPFQRQQQCTHSQSFWLCYSLQPLFSLMTFYVCLMEYKVRISNVPASKLKVQNVHLDFFSFLATSAHFMFRQLTFRTSFNLSANFSTPTVHPGLTASNKRKLKL